MKAVILAAGVGSRLGHPYPKCLCQLPDGSTILSRQLFLLRKNGIKEIYIVVGFKMTLIMEEVSDAFFKYNPVYYITNTSKSLLAGIQDFNDDIIWLNGDIIFDDKILKRIKLKKGNLITVNTNKCDQEEIKYSVDGQGYIKAISKSNSKGIGEAVGINKISRKDLNTFKDCLEECGDNDYFEKGIEFAIKKGIKFKPVNISDMHCIEIDFKSDFNNALKLFFTK